MGARHFVSNQPPDTENRLCYLFLPTDSGEQPP